MALLFLLLVGTFILYFFLLPSNQDIKNKKKIRNKNQKSIQMNKLNYDMEAGREISNIDTISTKSKIQNTKQDNQLLISNNWKKALLKKDMEVSRIPSDNFKVKVAPSSYWKEEKLWESFNKNKLVLLNKDPHWIYAYWNISEIETEKTKAIIRLYDITEQENNTFSDIDISLKDNKQYIKAPHSDGYYYGEIGLITKGDIFIALAKSKTILVPANKPHNKFGDLWMRVSNNKKEYLEYTPKTSLKYNATRLNKSSFSLNKK
ncbi:DUF4912 domain-containing protein [Orenia marismortui]|uniref:DUF4912 domain-containing protein n=1 Tax=Orenia marismortui TaxID=46469 RepID=UPI00037B030F|nr:DUF4912 domain-containing protein [Orenia marismortui]